MPALRALHGAGHEIAAVYSQPPRPAGRGHRVQRSPVHEAADALGLDVAVVAAYGLILPKAMLDAPHRGCLNIHASLLPRWRGAAPIHAAIIAGDSESGVTIMRMEEGLDTGPMLLMEATPIGPDTTVQALHDALSEIGARLVLRALAEDPPAIPQPEEGVTYAAKLTKEDGRLDWTLDAAALERRVRALNPWPGTFFTQGGEQIRVLAARVELGTGAPGTLLDDAALVATGAGALRLLRLQRPGRAAMEAEAFLRGFALPRGALLG